MSIMSVSDVFSHLELQILKHKRALRMAVLYFMAFGFRLYRNDAIVHTILEVFGVVIAPPSRFKGRHFRDPVYGKHHTLSVMRLLQVQVSWLAVDDGRGSRGIS